MLPLADLVLSLRRKDKKVRLFSGAPCSRGGMVYAGGLNPPSFGFTGSSPVVSTNGSAVEVHQVGCKPTVVRHWGFDTLSAHHASIVQWKERRFPKPQIRVRVLVGALWGSLSGVLDKLLSDLISRRE